MQSEEEDMKKTTLKPILMEDIKDYRQPSGLKYSPDGKLLAFQVQRADLDKNCYHTDIWLAENGSAKQVTWTIDATVVGFEDNTHLIINRKSEDAAPGETQLYILDTAGGEAKPWLKLPFPMRSFEKVSKGVYAALGMIDANDPDAYKDDADTRKKKAEEKKKDADYQVVDEVPYWFNGAGFVNKTRTALFLVETEPELKVKRITAPQFSVGSMKIHKGQIYFSGDLQKGGLNLFSKLYVYDVKAGKQKTLYGKNNYDFGGIFFLKDQMYVFANDMKRYGLNQTADICVLNDGKVETVYRPEVSLYSSVIGDTAEGGGGSAVSKNKYLTFATIADHNAIFEFDAKMKKTVLWEQPGMMCSMDASEDQIAVVFQDWNHVSEVYVMNRDGSDMKQLTDLNGEMLKGRYVAKPNVVDYKSEGYDLRGWVLLPQNFDKKKKYPAVLDIHGGPRTVYGETFFHEMQLWAARGYVVFFTNIKGSDGRGDDFADIRDDYGGTDFRNLMDFTDAVLKKYPNIDTTKICETGGSYGGFMTNWIIGHTDRFCCAASQRSISNWISFSFISDIGLYFGPDQNGTKGLFGDANTEQMWNHSPLKYAENVKTPTLFIHSDEDYRCPLPEGMQMMQALAYRNIETRMCIFHGENHELSRSGKPQHRIRRLQEITDWFDKHTK